MLNGADAKHKMPYGFDGILYNGLGSVEDANARLLARDALDIAAREIAPIFFRHGAAEAFGLNLLHNHWTVERDEVAEQAPGELHGEKILVTRPVTRAVSTGVPASWIVEASPGRSARTVFELSSDAAVVSIYGRLDAYEAFLSEAADALRRLDLHDTLGICILPREPLSADPTDRLFEVTTSDERASVVVARQPVRTRHSDYIQTCWQFAAAPPGGPAKPGSKPNDRYQCESRQSCVTQSVPIGPPNHASKKAHEHVDVN